MGHLRSDHRLGLLRLSVFGFAMLMGILTVGYFVLVSVIPEVLGSSTQAISSSDWRMLVLSLAMPAMPGAALSWWLFVLRRRRASVAAGGCAGLLTVVLAPLEVGVAGFVYGGFSPISLAPWQVIAGALYIWLFGLIIVCATPQGWGMLLVGWGAGAAYGLLVRRGCFQALDEEAAPNAGRSLQGSQEGEPHADPVERGRDE